MIGALIFLFTYFIKKIQKISFARRKKDEVGY
ncbi:hypothetical protein SAMN05421834_12727 [Halanaerobium kushneri]|uniref:Uncharacterized protein n=1 Tax=Halanaerobium kushneri TaxID=56779 RepID=A0A1N7B1U3_9FIRM|nr:hypothetical protein SAMN05421834_12727 [Halanaerobium kushneri]